MDTLDPKSYPIKRQKILTLTLNLDSSISPQSDKGKAPIIPDAAADNELPSKPPPQSCGICFSDEGKNFRGLIDSCDHYFCFLCVIEWSKIDSRCPLCRGRFSTVSRVRKDGSFIGYGVVRVPVRDQIYDPFGDLVDPYGHAKCCVCNGTKDESLLLLCDLCDSAMHTFCVGLGFTVPEGDWYCRDCDLLRAEQRKNDLVNNMESYAISGQHESEGHENERPSPSAPVSVFDIVREGPTEVHSDADRLLKLVSSPTKFSPGAASWGSSPTAIGELINARESSARTLRNCRNVHRHISVLRENWDAFRTGSLSFSSKLVDLSDRDGLKMHVAAKSAKGSCQVKSASQSSKSTNSLKLKVQDNSCNATRNQGSYNIERAWKLMDIAKSRADKAKGISKADANKAAPLKVHNAVPKCVPCGKTGNVFLRLGVQKGNIKVNGRLSSNSGYFGPVASSTSSNRFLNYSGCKSSIAVDVQIPKRSDNSISCLASCEGLRRGDPIFHDSACSTSSHGPMVEGPDVSCSNLLSLGDRNICTATKEEMQSSVQADSFCERVVLPSHASLGQGLSNVSLDSKHSTSLVSLCDNRPSGSGASCIKIEGKKVHERPRKSGAKVPIKTSGDDEAKGEILSLVKRNMKLLAKGKRLGHAVYKETARVSTHTILAACGLEHRNIVSFVPTLVCHHSDKIQQPYRSAIFANSCQECFHAFVKDVVNSILLEKLDATGVVC